MSLKDCLKNAADHGAITREEYEQLAKQYDKIARIALSPQDAKRKLLDELEAEAAKKKERAYMTEERRKVLEPAILGHRNARGQIDPVQGLQKLIESFGYSRFDDVEHRRRAIIGEVHAKMEALLDVARKGAVTGDLRRRYGETKVRLENMIRELDGRDTGDLIAKDMARMWSEVSDDLRQQFNAAGGDIGKIEKWLMPQHHDQAAMISAGKDAWIEYITPLLDADAMKHPLTGRKMSADELREALDWIWENVTTEGWLDKTPSSNAGRGAMFRRHADHRFLVFRDADAWIKYQKDFGEADPFAAMMGHVNTMARDIAAMQILGPNPDAMFRYLMQVVKQYGAQTGQSDPVGVGVRRAENMWLLYKGTTNTPGSVRAANIMTSLRSFTSATALGSAILSSTSDFITDGFARAMTGLPVTKAFTGMFSQFGRNARREAVRSGLTLDAALNVMHSQGRNVASVHAMRWTSYLADRNIALQGLSAWTQARKHAFGMDFQGAMADLVGTAYDALPKVYRNTLNRHGITAADWDVIRASPLHEPEPGATFLRPNEIADRDLSRRYAAMIMREMRFGTVEGALRVRAGFIGGVDRTQPGTFPGEILRSGAQFRGFAATLTMLQLERMAHLLYRQGMLGKAGGAFYAGAFLLTMGLAGAAAIQLKNLAAGRDPQDMDPSLDNKEFWVAAMLQSGGLGIYGDFMTGAQNRQGGGLAGTAMGPLVSSLQDVWNMTAGNLIAFGQDPDKPTNAGREFSNFAKKRVPLVSSLWYTKLAWQRTVEAQLQTLIDPEAASAFRRQRNQRKKQFGNDFFWQPGQQTPSRGPRLPQ